MGEHLLPASSSPYAIAQSLTSAARRQLPADLIKTVWNPDTCPVRLLTHLANTLSVDVWDESWDEEKKRRIIRRAILVQRTKGTLSAYREYAGYRDAEIVKVYRPPQRFFAGASATPAEHQAWLDSLPQIRIYLEGSKVARRPLIIAGGTKPFFLRRRFALASTAPQRAGQRAVIWRDGVETSIGTGVWNGTSELTISMPGSGRKRLFAGRRFGLFAKPSSAEGHIYRISIDADADLTAIVPGTRLQSTRIETVSASSRTSLRSFWAGSKMYRRFVRPSLAVEHVYECLRIVDDTVVPEPRRSLAFASVTRVGGRPKNAELVVSVPGKGSRLAMYAGIRSAGLFALPSRAKDRIQPSMNALAAAKRLTDTVLINTNVHRPLMIGTPLFIGTPIRLGAWTRS